jgi:hypothetical protein
VTDKGFIGFPAAGIRGGGKAIRRHFKALHKPMELPGSRILRPPVGGRVSGLNFGRWLCKTHCDYMIVHGMEPDPAYIRYAFLGSPGKPIFFHLAGSLGHPLRLADGRDPVVERRTPLRPFRITLDRSGEPPITPHVA